MTAALPLSVSQNFLKDPRLAAALIERCGIGSLDTVLEIGAGRGLITAQLALRCRQVIAVELDAPLAAGLQRDFAGRPNVRIIAGDFFSYPLPRFPYKVFANIPFSRTTEIVSRLAQAHNPSEMAGLVLQKEAAEMYLGAQRFTLRAILLWPWFELNIAHRFRRQDFNPAPHVDVVLLQMLKRSPPRVPPARAGRFRDFVTFGFTAFRPNLEAIFKEVFTARQRRRMTHELGMDWDLPPSALGGEQWLRLFECYQEFGKPAGAIPGSARRLSRQQAVLPKIHRTRAVKTAKKFS